MTGSKRDKLGQTEYYRIFICVLLRHVKQNKTETFKKVSFPEILIFRNFKISFMILTCIFWSSQLEGTDHQTAVRYQKAP